MSLEQVRRPVAVAVVIPSYRAGATIGAVLGAIPADVRSIYVVDDGCPDATGVRALRECDDPRLAVLHTGRNLGVGGAMKQGYRRALAEGADIIVKLDADGQMDPRDIPRLIAPILEGRADYAKGNRFAPASAMPVGGRRASEEMPARRRFANGLLSILHGAATGYWSVSDPANGYTAIRADALARLGKEALADCYFFETDMLFRLNLIAARVVDVPLPAFYPGGGSSLRLRRTAPRFAALMARRTLERRRAKRLGGLTPRELPAGVR